MNVLERLKLIDSNNTIYIWNPKDNFVCNEFNINNLFFAQAAKWQNNASWDGETLNLIEYNLSGKISISDYDYTNNLFTPCEKLSVVNTISYDYLFPQNSGDTIIEYTFYSQNNEKIVINWYINGSRKELSMKTDLSLFINNSDITTGVLSNIKADKISLKKRDGSSWNYIPFSTNNLTLIW